MSDYFINGTRKLTWLFLARRQQTSPSIDCSLLIAKDRQINCMDLTMQYIPIDRNTWRLLVILCIFILPFSGKAMSAKRHILLSSQQKRGKCGCSSHFHHLKEGEMTCNEQTHNINLYLPFFVTW